MCIARQQTDKHLETEYTHATIEKRRNYYITGFLWSGASGTYKRQTRPLVREGAPRKQERNCQTYSERK
jgi:hypothetical protein